MNRDKWGVEWTGINDSLNELEWMIHWRHRNEWFIEWTGMSDPLNEQG